MAAGKKNLMNEQQINNDAREASKLTSAGMSIPIEFGAELPSCLPIKIQSPYSVKNPPGISETSLIPALFQIAERFDGAKVPPAFRRALALDQDSIPEKVFGRDKLQAILKAITKRKKVVGR
jgi:hypothetical protein